MFGLKDEKPSHSTFCFDSTKCKYHLFLIFFASYWTKYHKWWWPFVESTPCERIWDSILTEKQIAGVITHVLLLGLTVKWWNQKENLSLLVWKVQALSSNLFFIVCLKSRSNGSRNSLIVLWRATRILEIRIGHI